MPSNVDVLNAIRYDADYSYQQEIPNITQGDIEGTLSRLQHSKPLWNQFMDGLINRIGTVYARSKSWSNPLSVLKQEQLYYGDTIEEIYTNLPQAQRYNPRDSYTDVFKGEAPDVRALYHTVNRQDFYHVSVNDSIVRRAFVDDGGLSKLIADVFQSPLNCDAKDEFNIMKNLIVEYIKNENTWFVKIPQWREQGYPTREQAAKLIMEKIRSTSGHFEFYSNAYNSAGVQNFCNRENQILFCTPEFEALLDVSLLAIVWNMDKADARARIILVDSFGDTDGTVDAVLCSENSLMCADTYLESESIRNPKSRRQEYYLHHDGIYSYSRFNNFAVFSTVKNSAETERITVSITKYTIATPDDYIAEPGSSCTLTVVSDGSVTPEGARLPDGCFFEVIGSNSEKTYVTPEGVLFIGENETGTIDEDGVSTINVVAKSAYTSSIINKPVERAVGELIIELALPE